MMILLLSRILMVVVVELLPRMGNGSEAALLLLAGKVMREQRRACFDVEENGITKCPHGVVEVRARQRSGTRRADAGAGADAGGSGGGRPQSGIDSALYETVAYVPNDYEAPMAGQPALYDSNSTSIAVNHSFDDHTYDGVDDANSSGVDNPANVGNSDC